MPFHNEMVRAGLPPISITENVNSLRLRRVEEPPTPFDDADQPVYDAVVGNPPYVRSERTDGGLDHRSREYYDRGPGGANLAALFVYRALDHWCKSENGQFGKISFVLPAGVFDGNETERLRAMFKPGQKFKIQRIVDLEPMHGQVFPEAKVIPVLLFAQIGSSKPTDHVEVITPDMECIERTTDGLRPLFQSKEGPSASRFDR